MPDAKTIVRLGQALGPKVMRKIHERVVQLSCEERVVTGGKMRLDTTAWRPTYIIQWTPASLGTAPAC